MPGPGLGLTWGQGGQQQQHPGASHRGSCQLLLGPEVTVVQALGQRGVVAGGGVVRTSLPREVPAPL